MKKLKEILRLIAEFIDFAQVHRQEGDQSARWMLRNTEKEPDTKG